MNNDCIYHFPIDLELNGIHGRDWWGNERDGRKEGGRGREGQKK